MISLQDMENAEELADKLGNVIASECIGKDTNSVLLGVSVFLAKILAVITDDMEDRNDMIRLVGKITHTLIHALKESDYES